MKVFFFNFTFPIAFTISAEKSLNRQNEIQLNDIQPYKSPSMNHKFSLDDNRNIPIDLYSESMKISHNGNSAYDQNNDYDDKAEFYQRNIDFGEWLCFLCHYTHNRLNINDNRK